MSTARPIYHLAPESELQAGARDGMYFPRGLSEDGFVHCSGSRDVALAVASDYFAELAEPLYVLEIDPGRLSHEVRFEPAAPAAGVGREHLSRAAAFPHVYGPIDLPAILGAGRLERHHSGCDWPRTLLPLEYWLRRDPIEVVDHDPAWLERFAAERGRIASLLGPELLEIHHVGSTAVPSAWAKPIVDVLAVVRDVARLDALDAAMRDAGYTPRGEYGIEGRRFFWKLEAGVRTLHLHAFGPGHPQIERMLRLRDHLRGHPADALAYSELKRGLALRHGSDVESYTNGKSEFVETLLREAARR